jgi:O-antigen/teichoic acid export membrane protein
MVAPEVVAVMLGPKWAMAVPFLRVLAIAQLFNVLMTGTGYVLVTLGHIRRSTLIPWSQVTAFAILAFVVFPGALVLDLAWIRLASMACSVIVSFWLMHTMLPFMSLWRFIAHVWRPIFASGAMAIAIYVASSTIAGPEAMKLAIKVTLGAVVYLAALLFAWLTSGRPKGAETYCLEKAATVTSKLSTVKMP